MEYVMLVLLALIVLSLAEAMYFLARDHGKTDTNRVLKALGVRIGLSVLLFLIAIASIMLGLVEPHGIVG